MSHVILHVDMNSFYANVECLYRPELRDKPVAVCGDPDARHGIVLTKNIHAKKAGVSTGEAIWQAKQKCPGLVVLPPNYELYLRFSRMARKMYNDYTDRVEAFGLDECWLDISGPGVTLREGTALADEIRTRMRTEFGITASVGVANNKVFAKLGSDMKKPDATTTLPPERYAETVWQLPVQELLYVGPSTRRKLFRSAIFTIGDLAEADPRLLCGVLGKWGEVLWVYANGKDESPVRHSDESESILSVGNSTTTPRDMVNLQDIRVTMMVLAESVASRLREHGLRAGTVQIHVRDSELGTFERQTALPRRTDLASELFSAGTTLFVKHYAWERPVRSLGIRGCALDTAGDCEQLSLLPEDTLRQRKSSAERTVDDIRRRYGHFSIQRGMMLPDKDLSSLDPTSQHSLQSLSFCTH